jgi:hypothetical protein
MFYVDITNCFSINYLGGGGGGGGCETSVPFFLDTVRKLGPQIQVQEVIFTSVSEFGPTIQQLVGKML